MTMQQQQKQKKKKTDCLFIFLMQKTAEMD